MKRTIANSNSLGTLAHPNLPRALILEFCYGVSAYLRDTWRYLRFLLISAVDCYYIINKLIILVPAPH
jgi:hypothetical protein